ncbi:5-methyltetrahydropteroyltriglutamate--homocysteine methyltransferase [Raoultella terrigena]|uniref:5-methyltetrahydropteroyltriglutamate--homocysteine methyltransferase n=1 Tax=Raoultella terrigena TaxID=577 RepID=A0A4V6J192_RAOTE|nr:5-methyltetrahydropteroyltriglutamate--homocysteine methyltransferase [Raoultella terrigena]
MQRSQAPFRADIVGSFLRPNAIKLARQQFSEGAIDSVQLRRVEDEAIRQLVQQQCDCGLHVVTDGEFRRAWWHFDFFDGLQGVERYDSDHGIQFNGVQTRAHGIRVTGKLAFGEHPMLEDFRFLQSISGDAQPKMTIPSPSVLHFRGGRKDIDATVYPDLADYFSDLATTWRDASARSMTPAAAICSWTIPSGPTCAPTNSASRCATVGKTLTSWRGSMPGCSTRPSKASRRINRRSARLPGNFRSTWISEGGYEPVAEVLFGSVNIDAFFLEYDNDRSGDFAPLRFIRPGHQQVVLGSLPPRTASWKILKG